MQNLKNEKEEKKIPPLEGKPNEFLIDCSDCVELRSEEEKGRSLFATRNIKPGSVLIVERPFSFSTDLATLRTNCLNCHASLKLDDKSAFPCQNCQAVSEFRAVIY